MAKRAVCVGINDYPGVSQDLQGCVNDANDWEAELTQRGYQVTKLLDGQAKREGMVGALNELVGGARDGDTIVFTYSGHGSWLPDQNGDEGDGRDEMLCPYDVASGQYLLDDDLHEVFGRKAAGAAFFFISDSCHSGSVTRFAPSIPGAAPRPRPRLLPPLAFVKDAAVRAAIENIAQTPRGSTTKQKYPALLLSGCKDAELSYDAFFNGRPNGALSRVALDALKESPGTPRDWWKAIRTRLPSADYPQTPQLYGGRNAKAGPLF